MRDRTTRRGFLGQGAGWMGLLAASGRRGLAAGAAPISAEEMVARGSAFLRSRQGEDGGWSTEKHEPGITALAVTALLRSRGARAGDPAVTRGLAYLEQFVDRKAGGLAGSAHANYATSIALMAFQEANRGTGGRYDAIIGAGQDFLKGKQWDEAEGKGRDSDFYGGAGYGGNNSRPDLSNTAFMMEALRETGLPADDPALRKALVFVSRCQNLKGEFNDRPWADKVDDGGFVYTAANGGSSVAGKVEANGGLRSYASMTYAGLKSMIHAGLTRDDPRVKAAYTYITKNYSLDENPGLGQQGLFYYYQTFAKALAMVGEPTVVDAQGKAHDWRAELAEALARRQEANGSWVNHADRFLEGDPNLVTSYALLAMAYARPKA